MADLALQWFGGAVERRFRALRPGVEELPWGSIDTTRYPAGLLAASRAFWTRAVLTEYYGAACFAELTHLMLRAGVPIDLVASVSDFVPDELVHVELSSRIAMALGGAAPTDVDLAAMRMRNFGGPTPLEECDAAVVHLACIETFNTHMLAKSLAVCRHPLISAVLKKILQDEAPHGRFGWNYLSWADHRLDDEGRARLGRVARGAIQRISKPWATFTSKVKDGVTTEGYLVEHVNELGWLDVETYVREARAVVLEEIERPLSEFDVVVPPAE